MAIILYLVKRFSLNLDFVYRIVNNELLKYKEFRI